MYKNLCSRDADEWQFLENKRRNLLSDLKNLKSKDPELQKANSIRVLEFGVGPGVNLYCYPPNTRLIAVDINKFFEDIFMNNLKKYENITLEKFLITSARDLREIPSNSIDAVVCTYTFSSVDDQLEVAKEIKRVLAKGGKWYFYEMVGYQNRYYRLLQEALRPIWRIWFNNWRLGYNIRPILEKAGFTDITLDYFELKEVHFLAAPNVCGTAMKPE
ncbi:methyltransferase-like protein 7A [Dinothrombium tinctorium]|uniref:Methyltransferase-like protein 7A n=1 Tax=Dinothrombium tinctorium TaxID=1965070 RepID=A0A3S3S1T1_9ACAR|nr:methyltransferase-like protein 7A [Dinothrombium tinctorium]